MIREKPYEYHPLEIKCNGCGSTIQYDYGDPKPGNIIYGYDYDVTPYYITCPCCGIKIQTGEHRERSISGLRRDYEDEQYNKWLDEHY